jgi:hypothetical protein
VLAPEVVVGDALTGTTVGEGGGHVDRIRPVLLLGLACKTRIEREECGDTEHGEGTRGAPGMRPRKPSGRMPSATLLPNRKRSMSTALHSHGPNAATATAKMPGRGRRRQPA